MREVADRDRIHGVLVEWRATTIDVDFVMRPEDETLLRAIPAMKESLQINLELASPADSIPVPPGWEDRGTFVAQAGRVGFFHFDLYAQALAKVERGHRQDLADVREMIARGLGRASACDRVLRSNRSGPVPVSGARPS